MKQKTTETFIKPKSTSKLAKKSSTPTSLSLRSRSSRPQNVPKPEQKPPTSQKRGRPRKSATKLVFEGEEKQTEDGGGKDDEKLSSLMEIEELCKGKSTPDAQVLAKSSDKEGKKFVDFVITVNKVDANTIKWFEKTKDERTDEKLPPEQIETTSVMADIFVSAKVSDESEEKTSSDSEILSPAEPNASRTAMELTSELIESGLSLADNLSSLNQSIQDKLQNSINQWMQVYEEHKNEKSFQPSEPHSTPSRADAIASSEGARTPTGILKKFDSPSTAEKKNRRVHFVAANLDTVQELKDSIEEAPPAKSPRLRSPQRFIPFTFFQSPTKNESLFQETISSTSRPLTTTKDTPNCLSFYPKLLNCTKPVSSIISKLAISGSSYTMHNLLKAKKITTIGDFARITEEELVTLPIKYPKLVKARLVMNQVLGGLSTAGNGTANPSSENVRTDEVLQSLAISSNPFLSTMGECLVEEDKENLVDVQIKDSENVGTDKALQNLTTSSDQFLPTMGESVVADSGFLVVEDKENLVDVQIKETALENFENMTASESECKSSIEEIRGETTSPNSIISAICTSILTRLKEDPTRRKEAHQMIAHLMDETKRLNEALANYD